MTRGDLLLLMLAAAVLALLYAHYWQAPSAASVVEIRNGTHAVERYALTESRQITVRGRIGNSVVDIRDGAVRFHSGPCRNQVCVHSGWLRHGGDTAACLPNGVSIRLLGGRDQVDGVS